MSDNTEKAFVVSESASYNFNHSPVASSMYVCVCVSVSECMCMNNCSFVILACMSFPLNLSLGMNTTILGQNK